MPLKFYRDEPLFGLDIGHASIKAMQIDAAAGKPPVVLGYGNSGFDPAAIENGVITKPKVIAQAMHELFDKSIVGSITSRRVACALPTSHTFSRPMKIPIMEHDDIVEAIHLEAEQYIPIPLPNLYIDYEVSSRDEQNIELLLVATSKNIVDSYLKVLESLELEPVAMEPSINAASRLLHIQAGGKPGPSILVDIGSVTTDIAVFDKNLLVASTVNTGGDNITRSIAQSMHMSEEQATSLKNEFGISFNEKQQRTIDAIKPLLDSLVHEIQKTVRYYSERGASAHKQISQVVSVGGGAIMPGLNQYLSKELRLPTHNLDPWQKISFGQLALPPQADQSIYITAAGEAVLHPGEILV